MVRRVAMAAPFLVVCVVLYFPVFSGQIPFPANLVTGFAPWPGEFSQDHAEIGDLSTQIYPWRNLSASAIRDGTIPLWNAHIFGGTPFVANSQSAVFYPPNVLYYALPVPLAWSLAFMLHAFLAGVFMTLFLREIECEGVASVAGGLVFAMSGFVTVWRGYPMGQAAVWLPLACYGVVRLSRQPSGRNLVLTAVAFAMPVLAGHPETAFHVALAGMSLAALEWLTLARRKTPGHAHILFPGYLAAAGGLAIALAAVQLLPTLEWIQLGTMDLDSRWPTRPLSQIWTFVSRDLSRAVNANGVDIPEGAAYAGAVTLIAAALAALGKPRRYVVFLAVLGFVAFECAFGLWPAQAVVERMPIVAGMKNGRLLLVVDFTLAALAGIGFSYIGRIDPRKAGALCAASILAGGATIGGLAATYLAWRQEPGTPVAFSTAGAAAFLIAGSLLFGLCLIGRLSGRRLVLLCTLLIAVDLTTFSRNHVPFHSPEEIYPEAPLFQELRNRSDPSFDRVVSLSLSYAVNTEMMYGLRSPGGYDNASGRIRSFFEGFTSRREDGIEFTGSVVAAAADRRFDLFATRYLIASSGSRDAEILSAAPDRFERIWESGSIQVYENLRAFPGAFLVPAGGIEVHEAPDERLRRMKDSALDPAETVILDRAPAYPGGRSSGGPESDRILAFDRQANAVRIRVQTASNSVLVLSEAYYPGWLVRVDGRDADLLEADYALMGVGLGPGVHDVEFEFTPALFRGGMALSIAGLLSSLVLASGLTGRRLDNSAGNWISSSRRAWMATTAMIIPALLALAFIRSIFAGAETDPVQEMRMYVEPDRVTAGEDSYRVLFTSVGQALVRVRYTRDDGPVEEFTAELDPSGSAEFFVSSDTRRGTYRFLEFLPPGRDQWIPTTETIIVE